MPQNTRVAACTFCSDLDPYNLDFQSLASFTAMCHMHATNQGQKSTDWQETNGMDTTPPTQLPLNQCLQSHLQDGHAVKGSSHNIAKTCGLAV